MWLLIGEALGAVAVLALIVWWTMFSGRKGGEREAAAPPHAPPEAPDAPDAKE